MLYLLTEKILIKKHYFLLIFLLFIIISCQEKEQYTGKLRIVCTTSMVADALRNIVGDSAEVISLMGAGVDPHLYKATHGDIKRLLEADVVCYNGLHLEGKMGEIMKKLARQKPIIALGNGIESTELISTEGDTHIPDPHIWFDITLWAKAVKYGGQELIKIDKSMFQGQRASYFKQNTEKYLQKLDSLNQQIKQTLSLIPANQRVLITSHDAFSYFGRAYRLEVRGLQGISTLSDFGLKDVSDLVNFIVKNKIKAIFVETSMSEQSIKAVMQGCYAQGHRVQLGGKLFSDALGKKGTMEGTYMGMISANTNIIVSALK
jgi:manganese/zinc/iron transport system substrate-binding protein